MQSPCPISAFLDAALEELRTHGLLRELRSLDCAQGPVVELSGRRVLNFSSNDYLGLAAEPFLQEAAQEAVARFGTGAGASRLISGNQPPHRELETALADFKGTRAALAFACGYSTALGVIPALVGRDDVVVMDKLSHACLVDGARLSGAVIRIFPHNDVAKLESHLRWARGKHPRAKILVVTESVFSMDGDLAPLAEIAEAKDRYGAWLLVDEAHGIGVIGESGRGLVDALGLGERVEVQMGTLGKALGCAGGYIAGSRALADFLLNRARSFIFSTAPPPAQAASACAALRWLPTAEGRDRIAQLLRNREQLARLCPGRLTAPPPSAIVPFIVGRETSATRLAGRLLDAGIFIPAVRYPAVAKGSARLRLTLTALHRPEHLAAVADVLHQIE